MQPWKRLGFPEEGLSKLLSKQVHEDEWLCDPPANPEDMELWLVGHYCGAYLVYALGCIGYTALRPPLNDWMEVGRRIVESAKCHFFGRWQEVQLPSWVPPDKSKVQWNDHYRESISIAAALGDWRSIDELLSWPSFGLRFDRGSFFHTELDNLYQIWLAARLRGEQSEALASAERQLLTAEHPRARLLTDCAIALLDQDEPAFGRHLVGYLGHHSLHEVSKVRADTVISCDGTFLFRIAKRRGMSANLPEDLSVYIATPLATQ